MMAPMFRFKFPIFVALYILMSAIAGSALADDDDHDAARRAFERGEIHSLSDVLGMVQQRVPGEVISIEFEDDDGRFIYEIKVISTNGRYTKIYVDARTNSIIRTK